MSKEVSLKQGVIVIAVLGLVGLSAGYLYPLLKSENKTQQRVPDGFVKTKSTTTETEIVHEFEKPAPKKLTPKQTPEESFARYMDALPESEIDVGIEYQKLYKSRQNAQLYADYTSLMARAKENQAKIKKANNVIKGKKEPTKEPEIELLDRVQNKVIEESTNVNNDVSNELSDEALDVITLKGIYAKTNTAAQDTYGAIIRLNGASRRVSTGSILGANLNVVKVNSDSVVVQSLNKSRTLRLEGGFGE